MLRECQEHGYFRDQECPICGGEGKFIMDKAELDHIGRTLAGVLRHFPDKFRLKMDGRGWVNVQDFVRSMQKREKHLYWLRPYHVFAIIETDPKGIYTQIIQHFIASSFYQALLQSIIAESSSRFRIMEEAQRNAGEIITTLTQEIQSERKRQITREMQELAAGAGLIDNR